MVAAAILVAGCGQAETRPVAQRPPLISIFEAPTQLISRPEPTLEVLHRLGVQYVRVMIVWRSVAPDAGASAAPANFDASNPAAYPAAGWAPYDAIVRDAQALHMGVLFNITGGAPNWAMGPGFTPGGAPGVWRPSAARFGPFAQAVGTRYSGHYVPPGSSTPLPRVSFWSIWNEPNLGEADLAPQTVDNSTVDVSPTMYRQLLDTGWSALHQTGHGSDTILIGELAPYGQAVGNYPGTFGYMVPMRFLRALYCVDASLRPLRGAAAAADGCPSNSAAFASQNPALFRASGFAMHPYPDGAVAPNVVVSKTVDPGAPEFVYLATISRLEHFLDAVTREYGATNPFPIYSTEYGYKTNPPYAGGAPLALAPAYENWAEYLTWRNPRLRSWDHYLLLDPPVNGPSEFTTGLEFASGALKPTFAAFRMPIYLPVTDQRGGGLEVWGCVRPVNYAAQPQHVDIQLQAGGHGDFSTVRSVPLGPGCYFDATVRFRSGGNVRLAWSYPHGPTIYSRLVAITVS
jgi:hypothetical protein